MPHKRAKRSIREDQRAKHGSDEAPSSIYTSKQTISTERIPKSVSRVLNAVHVRQEWRDKKRKFESGEDTGEREAKIKRRQFDEKAALTVKTRKGHDVEGRDKVLGIQPGESLAHFNRRVEDDMRPIVKSAIQSSSAQSRKVKKSELDSKAKNESRPKDVLSVHDTGQVAPPPPDPISKHNGRPTEFQKSSTSAPRRLNDIAQAPPEFKKLPRGTGKDGPKATGSRDGVLSMKQKLMMEEEREKAIVRYRQLKERRRVAGGVGERDAGGDTDE